MQYWWVNQNQTFKHEFYGGYMWSPKFNANGAINPFYENMRKVQPGDTVFSFAGSKIQGVGVATSRATTFPKPLEFGKSGDYWSEEGWHVEVSFAPLQNPIRIKDRISEIADVLPEKYSPLRATGEANQIYLAEVPENLATRLMILLGDDFHNTLALAGGNLIESDEKANEAEKVLTQRTDIGLLQINQLVKARRGQGVFKNNVKLIESSCRVTKLELQQHLVASHIKPWAESNDFEKLDGSNGLLLSPHIDHLFDRGFMSFRNDGDVVWSPRLQYRVLDTWKIDYHINVGTFTADQKKYLEYHRDVKLIAS